MSITEAFRKLPSVRVRVQEKTHVGSEENYRNEKPSHNQMKQYKFENLILCILWN